MKSPGTDSTPVSWGGAATSGKGSTTATYNLTLFVLNPGQYNTRALIECNLGESIELFNSATKKLQYRFDGKSTGINLFNEKLLEIYKI